MTTAAATSPYIGYPEIGNTAVIDTIQDAPLGTIVPFNNPYWGGGEAMYCKMPTSTALSVGTCVIWDNAYLVAAVPNTANLGQPVGFLMNALVSNAAAQYGWVAISGVHPCFSGASVAANTALGITAAGKLGAIANGKQILNCRSQVAATTTVVKANTTTLTGSLILKVSNADGWFIGVVLTGTGIAAGATVAGIDPDNRTVTMSAVATATGSVSVTGTYNDASAAFWNVCAFDRPFAQGQVT